MFEDYLYEIIATIVILVILTIYAILKLKLLNKKQDKEDEITQINLHEMEKNSQEIEEIHLTEDKSDDLDANAIQALQKDDFDGDEEGDFGVDESTTSKPKAQQETQNESVQFYKREVPVHEKITKQKFTEFSGQRILVAEDNLINQKVLTGLLAGSGIDIVMADDGQEALDILKDDTNFLMILMDAHMPRLDGFEATQIIRKNPQYNHILIVALSGDTAADDIAKMKAAGMSEQLEKPLRMDALYDIFYAYTGNDNLKNDTADDDEDLIEVVMTKALNGDKGLEVCGGDDTFYREILKEFVTNYEDSAKKLHTLLVAAKIQEADKLLLDIIGITANIGADKLNEIAYNIKSALSDTHERSYLTLTDVYANHLKVLIRDIREYL